MVSMLVSRSSFGVRCIQRSDPRSELCLLRPKSARRPNGPVRLLQECLQSDGFRQPGQISADLLADLGEMDAGSASGRSVEVPLPQKESNIWGCWQLGHGPGEGLGGLA